MRLTSLAFAALCFSSLSAAVNLQTNQYLSEDLLSHIKETFRQLDHDGDGRISAAEWDSYKRAQGQYGVDVEEMDTIDTDRDNSIDI